MPDDPSVYDEFKRAARVMERHGGGFASKLATAALHADPANAGRLLAAFPELWERYADPMWKAGEEEAPAPPAPEPAP